MANNDIKQRIVLEGEQEYKNAIKDAQRNLKTLRSELKAETAEMGRNATEQQKTEAKVRSLKQQIAEQEKIVKANRDALKEVREKYADNTDAIAKYEQKLNESRTALANMKNELEGVGQGFRKVEADAGMATVAANSVADSLGKLGDIGTTISDSIEGIFTTLFNTVTETASRIWTEVVNIAARANNWTDTAAFLGSTASEVQTWDRAITAAQGDFTKLTAAITRLKYSGKGQAIAELFGVSDANYTNDLEYTAAVLSSMAEAEERMKAAGTWDSAMGEIFGGRKSAEVEWFINNWDRITKNLETFNAEEGGFGLTEEELSDMNALYLQVGEIQEKWNALKESITTKLFGGLVMDITTNANGLLDAFKKYFDAESPEEREAALEEIRENILAIFERVKQAITDGIKLIDDIAQELQESDDPTAQAIGKLMGSISSALEWFTEGNMDKVIRALELLRDFWIGAKIATMIANIASFAAHISTLTAAGGINAATAGAAAGTSWGTAFASAVMKAAPWLIGLWTLLNPSGTSDEIGDNTIVDEAGNLTKEAVEYGYEKDENGDVFLNRDDTIMKAVQTFWDQYRTGKLGKDEIADMDNVLLNNEAMNALMQAVWDFRQEHPKDWQSIEDLPATFFSDNWKFMTNGGNSGSTDALTGTDARDMTGAVRNMPAAVARAMTGITVNMDGQTVGRLVAPYVSRQIATYIF